MGFNALAGQRLLRVEVLDPWRESGSQRHTPPSLSGALVMVFESAALICTSPLRYFHNQQGTQYGLPSGAPVSLGYRITTCDCEDVKTVPPITFGLPPGAEYRHPWMQSPSPAIGMVLAEIATVGLGRADGEPAWGIELRFASGLCYWLSYRPELDGSIELDMPGQHFGIDQIIVRGGRRPWRLRKAVRRHRADLQLCRAQEPFDRGSAGCGQDQDSGLGLPPCR
ncbi:MAG: hypothetical protein M0P52_00965 [Rhodoferax sp.]|nr:hypothetical protein [Rhodoferax sp.]